MLSIERLRPLLVELVEDPALQELLVGHADLYGVAGRAPARHKHSGTLMRPRRRRLPKVEVRKRSETDAESLTISL